MPSVDLRTSLASAALATCVACSAGPTAETPADHDRPVPASEPRAELGLEVDLEPARDCEERFDLALYEDRAVDLIAWDEQRGRCIDRRVSIRYLSRKLSADALFERVRELTLEATRVPSEPVSPP